jgi:ABC-2 type transport system permease protein
MKFWRVAGYEYRRHVLRRRFVLTILGLPLFIGLMIGVTAVIIVAQLDDRPVGYVDHPGILLEPASNRLSSFSQVDLIPYQTEIQALAALNAAEIQAYYVLPAEYPRTKQIKLYYLDEPPDQSIEQQFRYWVRASLLKDEPPDVVRRLIDGVEFVIYLPDGSRQPLRYLILVRIVLPMVAGFAFVIALFTSAGYLMQAVVEEKENRTMEVLITSLPAGHLIAGKIVGISAVGLTQILTWIASAAGGVLIGRNYLEWMQTIRLEPDLLLIMALTMLPAYVTIAALMTAIGSTVTRASEGQQMTGLFTLPVVIPYWFAGLIISNPNSPLVIGLSLFPLTAPVTMTLRSGVTAVPIWQIALVTCVLVSSAVAAIWAAGRVFQLGMLSYGQRLGWRDIINRKA